MPTSVLSQSAVCELWWFFCDYHTPQGEINIYPWAFCSIVLLLRGGCTIVSYFIMCKYFFAIFLCHQLSCRLIYKMVVRQLVILWSALYIVWKRQAVAVRLTWTEYPTKSHIQQLAICVAVLIGVSYNMAVLEKTHIQYRIYIYITLKLLSNSS